MVWYFFGELQFKTNAAILESRNISRAKGTMLSLLEWLITIKVSNAIFLYKTSQLYCWPSFS
jgi:hypothetical protein